jgi:hypothetical protein
MTLKDIAEAAGCSDKTVRRWISENMPGKVEHGKVTRFTFSEASKVMEALPKRNMVSNSGQMSTLPEDRLVRLEVLVEKLIGVVVALIPNQASSASPPRSLAAPQIKPRDNVNKIVREFAHKQGIEHSVAFGDLYREFGYRTNTDPRRSAKNRGMAIIDYIETEGMIDTLEAVAIEWSQA